jgi:hypothetical protein
MILRGLGPCGAAAWLSLFETYYDRRDSGSAPDAITKRHSTGLVGLGLGGSRTGLVRQMERGRLQRLRQHAEASSRSCRPADQHSNRQLRKVYQPNSHQLGQKNYQFLPIQLHQRLQGQLRASVAQLMSETVC